MAFFNTEEDPKQTPERQVENGCKYAPKRQGFGHPLWYHAATVNAKHLLRCNGMEDKKGFSQKAFVIFPNTSKKHTPSYMRACPLVCTILLFAITISVQAQNVTTQHNDLNRTGWNAGEKLLNTKNVKAGSFGKIFTRTVDDQIYAQPLVVLHVNIPNMGTKNIVYVATVNNTVYAFDADSANANTPYWEVNLTPQGSRVIKNTDMTNACGGGYRDFSGNMGIVGTPVIDTNTNTLYVVARSLIKTTGMYEQYLHALDITTGAERANSPKLVTATVNGNGDGNANGVIHFDAQKQNQRSGLLLLNGVVYITWASHCDWGPYHGWIMGYDKTSLDQKTVYNTTPEGYNGGIWMSGGGPSADEQGNIYAAVGNGSIGRNNNPSDLTNRSESALKLTPSGNTLSVATFFSPKNIEDLEAADLDFGVTEIMLLPNTNRAMTGCKDGHLYVLDKDNMGGYSSTSNNVAQTIDLGVNAHMRGSLSYYKGAVNEYAYVWSENSLLQAYPFNRSTNLFDLNNTIKSGVQGPVGNSGAVLSVSSNGSLDSTAILWASYAANGDANQSVRPGILRAFAANDVTKELWNSSIYPNDNPGNYAKFNCPTVANGKVYLATFSNKLAVYGLSTVAIHDTCSSTNIALNKTATASSTEGANSDAAYAVDGNINTKWSSGNSDPQSIYIDLGKRYDLCSVTLRWPEAPGRDFQIQLSDDAQNWTSLVNITGNEDTTNYLPIQGSGRYVRMYGTAQTTQSGYKLNEFEVYGMVSANQCAPPAQLSVNNIYENAATLHWSTNGATHFSIQYKTVSAGSWTTVESDSNEVTLTGLACATDYFFQVQAKCSSTEASDFSPSSSFTTLQCNANCEPLPTRWTTQDIGDVEAASAACFSNGVFTLEGSGTDIWDTQDAFRFAYKTFVGDGDIIARVLTMDQTSDWNKCGIMIRESLTPGSRHAFIAMTSGNGVAFQSRPNADGFSDNVNIAGVPVRQWLKLSKVGSVYTAYHSADGQQWTQVGDAVDANFGSGIPVYAGLALTSHNNGVISTATVDNYAVTGVLLITLQRFTGNLTFNKTVALQWTTSLEKNIQNFIIERSSDNLKYAPLDTVQAVNNGTFLQNYSYEDKAPLQGINYYRLRMTNNDGLVTYSSIVAVRIANSVAPALYPNPVAGVLHVMQSSEAIQYIRMFDVQGKLVAQANKPTSAVADIPVRALANGIYFVEITTATSVYKQKIIVKN